MYFYTDLVILCAVVGLKVSSLCVCVCAGYSAKGYVTPHFHTNVQEDEQMGCLSSTPSILSSFYLFNFLPLPSIILGQDWSE